MRLTLRVLGLDLIDLAIETDAPVYVSEDDSPGDCTTYPIGFSTPDPTPHEIACPDRDL